MTVNCPVDGCDYEGVPKSVAAHHAGKKDDAHKGGYEACMKKLEDQGIDTEQASAEPQGEATDGSQADERAKDNPVFDGQAHDPDGASRSTDNPECPDCEEELYHRNELDPNEYRLEHDEADYGCLSCGGEFKDE